MSDLLQLGVAGLFVVALGVLAGWWAVEQERQQRVRRLRAIERQTAAAIQQVRARYEQATKTAMRQASSACRPAQRNDRR